LSTAAGITSRNCRGISQQKNTKGEGNKLEKSYKKKEGQKETQLMTEPQAE